MCPLPGHASITAVEPPGDVPWAGIVERAVASAPRQAALLPAATSWQEAFAVPFRPFLTDARGRLRDGMTGLISPGHADIALIADAFTEQLGRRLAGLAARTLTHELNQARAAGRVAGRDGRARLAAFIGQVSAPAGVAALVERYPVLGRLLGTAAWLAVEAALELMGRLAADRGEVISALLGGTDPGPAVTLETGLGDPHGRGRTVASVVFADGRRVVYKPRDMAVYGLFADVVRWLNERLPGLALRSAGIVRRPGYGWQECIEWRPLASSAAKLFYRRQGALLAVLYVLHATDIHCENLIASGDDPVLVDVETLLHPDLPPVREAGDDPAAEALAASVRRSGLLPYLSITENGALDVSGMGGDRGNRPGTVEEVLEPADYEAATLDGFRLGYDAIMKERRAFSELIESRGQVLTRVVFRPSRTYARLLDECTSPDLLRDENDRDAALGVLRDLDAHPLWRRLVRHERDDLRVGDIPLLTCRAGTGDVTTSAGHRMASLLDRSGLGRALDKVSAMSETDRCDQEWLITASLATRRPAGDHRCGRTGPAAVTAAGPDSLLAAACALADQIIACRDNGGGRVNWLGLQLVEGSRWMVLPMGADLASGYPGVALFLAQLAGLTGIPRYAETARQAVRPVAPLLDALAGRPDLIAAIGCGGTDGLGGVSYALARLASLLEDAELRAAALAAAGLASRAADGPSPACWASGLAGCLAAMTAVGAETGEAALTAQARISADRLTELVERTDGWCAPPDAAPVPGFAAGAAGVAWALTRFGASQADPRYSAAGRHAASRAITAGGDGNDRPDQGWCSGAAGIALARVCLAGDCAIIRALPGPAAAGRPPLLDLSLCHGEAGIADVLASYAGAFPGAGISAVLRRRAGLILGAISHRTRYCGTPGGVPTPGLISGLAGIGYGLLRLAFGARVPSVLLLEPAPRQVSNHHA